MSREINVTSYHNEPIATIKGIPDLPGAVWKVRQPSPADRFAVRDVAKDHRKRVMEYATKKSEEAQAKRAEIETEAETKGEDPDAAVREWLDKQTDEDQLPMEYTMEYLNASILAVYVTPDVDPALLMEKLGPGIINELLVEVNQVLTGDAAKKKLGPQNHLQGMT